MKINPKMIFDEDKLFDELIHMINVMKVKIKN